jgi:hypothetical protein
MAVELFTSMSRITGEIATHHIHVRDELNDTRVSILVFRKMKVAMLRDLQGQRISSTGAWLEKTEILIAVPYHVKGTTSMLTQRTIQSRIGRNEHRILIDLPPFRIEGDLYFVGKLRVEDVLRRDRAPFGALSNAQVTFLPDPSVSFVAEEIAFNCDRVKMLCTAYKVQVEE